MVDIYDADTGQWSSGQLASPLIGLTTVSVGGKALFAGGVPGISEGLAPPSSEVDIYDAQSGQWSTASLSIARRFVLGTSVDGLALFAGGYAGQSYGELSASDVVDIYNSVTNEWSTATMPEGIGNYGTAVSAGNLALFCDQGTSAQLQLGTNTNIDVYDAVSGTWSQAALSQRRGGIAVASVDGDAIFAGGYYERRSTGSSHPSDVVDIFNADTDSWTTSRLPIAMRFSSSVALGNDAFFVGSSPAGVDVVEAYDATTGQWSATTLASNSYAPAAVAADGKLIVANASGQYDQSANPLEVLSSTDDEPPEPELPGTGRIFGAPPSVFKWSPTAGATSYDVYVDGSLAATVNDNRWTPSLDAVVRGSHSWYVVAHVDGGPLGSALTNYYVTGPVVEARLQALKMHSTAFPGASGKAYVTISISNVPNPSSSVVVSLLASYNDDLSIDQTYLGTAAESFAPHDLGTIRQIQIPITIPMEMTPGNYYLALTVKIGTSSFTIYLNKQIISIGTPPKPQPFPPLEIV